MFSTELNWHKKRIYQGRYPELLSTKYSFWILTPTKYMMNTEDIEEVITTYAKLILCSMIGKTQGGNLTQRCNR
jgi:hypothetical protein